jgi:unsaturated chondroitin disaccharide hydrolase
MISLDEAVACAVNTIDRNLVTFAETYPDDATEAGIYPVRRARKNYPAGSHTGWTTGFWAGMLWLAYELTGAERYRAAGEIQLARFADRLQRHIDVDHHDLGFLYSLSCVAAARLTGSALAHQTALAAADRLMTRYLPGPGVLQAWGTLDDPEQRGRTIVDSLMNVPLLYWATAQTGERRYADAAKRHAEQLMQHFVRPDGSTYHTFYFDVDTGAPRFGRTHQGHADESTWSRGQAWALYGLALSMRHTRDDRFLRVGERVADVFLAHTPADGVVYWDFAFGDGSGEPKDSSASAIAACGLLELAQWDPALAPRYRQAATDIVQALWTTCATRGSAASNALLLHGTQNRNSDAGVDEGNLWGDYFYLEALTRLSRPDWIPYW